MFLYVKYFEILQNFLQPVVISENFLQPVVISENILQSVVISGSIFFKNDSLLTKSQ